MTKGEEERSKEKRKKDRMKRRKHNTLTSVKICYWKGLALQNNAKIAKTIEGKNILKLLRKRLNSLSTPN